MSVYVGRIQYSGFLLSVDVLVVDFTGYSCVAFGGGPSVNRQNQNKPLGVSLASGNFAIQEGPRSGTTSLLDLARETPRGASIFFFFFQE